MEFYSKEIIMMLMKTRQMRARTNARAQSEMPNKDLTLFSQIVSLSTHRRVGGCLWLC